MNDKTRILNFARDKFFTEGFYKISMDEIAAGMKMSKKTIYKYFPSKSILINSTINSFKTTAKKEITQIIGSKENAIIKIKLLSNFFADLSLQINEKMISDLQTHQPDMWHKIDEFRSILITEIWTKIIEQGKGEGYIVDIPNEIIVTVILSSIRGVINPVFLINNKFSIKEAFNITFEILVSGILTEKGKKTYNKLKSGTTQ